ncbi:MAG: LysM peptidoglycan-binding domain-containing protein [Puniceicoccales bacterium]|nr:LysM peptidoglycan-binding domain-containing protein [Puniceicoccales bacterium]
MLKPVVYMLFVASSVIVEGSKKKENFLQQKSPMDELAENMAALRQDINNLTAGMHKLQREVDCLKLQGHSLSENQETQVKKIAETTCCDSAGIVDQKVNALSLAFSQEINAMSERINGVLNVIISAINAQRKLSSMIKDSETKQSKGIIYEVEAGETLDGIAAKFTVPKEDIKKLNFIADENHLSRGLVLFIPQGELVSSIK